MLVHQGAGRALPAAAGIGLCAAAIEYVVTRHYLHIGWEITAPIPVVWWVAGTIAGVLGTGLLLVPLGRHTTRLIAMSWPRLLLTWVVPGLLAHLGWLAGTLALLHRFNPEFTGAPVRNLGELAGTALLPPPELSLLYALALFPICAKAARRLPAAALVATFVVVAAVAPAATFAVFLTVGLRFAPAVDKLLATATRRDLLPRGAVAAVGIAVLGIDRIPPALGAVVAGLAALPFGLTAAALLPGRRLAAIGTAAVPGYLLLVPALGLADAVLLPRLSLQGTTAQLVAATVEPLVLATAVVIGGLALRAMTRRRPLVFLSMLLVLPATGCAPLAEVDKAAPEITLTFAGDVHFEGRADRLLDAPLTAFGDAAKDLAAGDLTFVNLETPITRRGAPEPKRYLFRARDAAVPALKAAGVDAVSLANNHSLDYGREGLADTLAAARRGGLGTIGAGSVDEAYRPWEATVRGSKIAVLAFDQVDDLADQWAAQPGKDGLAMAFDRDRALAAVRAARANSDLVVVLPHWGTEGSRCPDAHQFGFAAALIEAGADIIVGAHAHVLQGAGRSGNAFVAYGLGNFLWYSSGLHVPHSARAGVLTLTVRGRTVVGSDFVPTVVSDTGQPAPVTGWQAAIARHHFADLRGCAKLDPLPTAG
ncbi:CapA family protein [Actinoplanes sp. NPDC051859]|uniref:CapA family protein n=1 Tax=Actinoplanes sp. NPDC051859 TaxID=3363909 RepID=UPI0037A067E0